MQEEQIAKPPSTVFTLLIGALAYTAGGLAAGILLSYALPTVGLPAIGLLPFLAFWWVWFLFVFPPITLFVSLFRATALPPNSSED